jgi:molybdopterin converting factor small subunit
MPRVRLFGPVADAAGTRVDEMDGASVAEVLDAARARYGADFADQISMCRIWVNGEVPQPGMTLQESDEVALLPPVSGG